MKIIALTLLIALVVQSTCAEPGAMQKMLNGMQLLMEGGGEFDPGFFSDIIDCLNSQDPRLVEVHDKLWSGWQEYASTNGQPSDNYPHCPSGEMGNLKWFEDNCTMQTQQGGDISIYEPCNYASNMAYYHMSVEICQENYNLPADYVQALSTVASFMGFGSAFLHGSQTSVGGKMDVRMEDTFSFTAYQAAVKSLEPLGSSIISDLSLEPRQYSGIEITEQVVQVYQNYSVYEWKEQIDEVAKVPEILPEIYVTFCGYLEALLSLTFPEEFVDLVVDKIINNIGGFPEPYKEFCIHTYLDEFRLVTNDLVFEETDLASLKTNSLGMAGKLIYACLWQEDLIANETLLTPEANEMGAQYLPIVNTALNQLMDFEHSNHQFQLGNNVYPGEDWCAPVIPHAKWHVETAIAFLDFLNVGIQLDEILSKAVARKNFEQD